MELWPKSAIVTFARNTITGNHALPGARGGLSANPGGSEGSAGKDGTGGGIWAGSAFNAGQSRVTENTPDNCAPPGTVIGCLDRP